ncbi:hypothetical protein N7457_006961 [Penicillium paradoxum]|uniref:uncharacterized protein n=1 Tax=Penicillium paradoxum TaxID=176176 RepID=UPI002548B8DE|nr:uncharacterized protein N7457_006961 [Penicillium paradoxum]KAJ5779241.1 hypothetical protein N7457_006961 [Penicillium paradoxum]
MSLPALDESHSAPPGPIAFSQEQIRCLEEADIFLPQITTDLSTNKGGKRKVSAAFSAPRAVSSSSTSSVSSSVSISTRGFQPDVIQTFDIPIAEESIEVLEYIGFIPDIARVIYDRYSNRPKPSQTPDDLMAYVSGHLVSLNLPQFDNIEPKTALSRVGLTRQIQDAITDPRFSHISGTETLLHWAIDTVETNYAALRGQQQLLQSHANQRIAHNKEHKRPKHEPQQSVTATINVTPKDFNLPESYVTIQTDIEILENHISLFKGKSYLELNQTVDIIGSDGTVNLSALRTHPSGDFNWWSNAYYWTPEKETAEEYRLFAARRSPTANTCIVHIQIPQSFVSSLRLENLWYSPNWKDYIWTCRKGIMPDPKFDYLWKPGRADIVRGPISTSSKEIIRIRREDVQSSINEDHVMCLPSGRKACQWVFVQHDTINLLAEQIRGKMHFIIFEAVARFPV